MSISDVNGGSRKDDHRVRIPAWSCYSSGKVNGESAGDVTPGAYWSAARKCPSVDTILVSLDMRGRVARKWPEK